MRKTNKCAAVASAWMLAAPVQAVLNESIILSVEEPGSGSVATGIANVRGWAVAPNPIDRIELFIDDESKGVIPYGGSRGDVAEQYPALPDSGLSGFSAAFNYSLLSVGTHSIRIRAIDSNGDHQETSVTFDVVAFDSPFISGNPGVSIANATISKAGEAIRLDNVNAQGQAYDVTLQWRPASQSFYPVQIARHNPADNNPDAGIPDFKGSWALESALEGGGSCLIQDLSGTYDVTQQAGSQFSGNLSVLDEVITLGGQVDASGEFNSSANLAVSLLQGCEITAVNQGNFLSNTVRTTLTALSAGCPELVSGCLNAVFSGTIIKQ